MASVKWKSSEICKMLLSGGDYEEIAPGHLTKCEGEAAGQSEMNTLAGGEVGDYAGSTTEARFSGPGGLAIAPGGSVYIADTGNGCIKVMSGNGAVVTTMAKGLHSPTSLVLDTGSNALYICDTGANVIYRQDTRTHFMDAISGEMGQAGYLDSDGNTRNAKWNAPTAMVLDPTGDLLVCDSGNHCVRRVELSKQAEGALPPTRLFAGTPGRPECVDGPLLEAQFNWPVACALGTDGVLVVADRDSKKLRTVSLRGVLTMSRTVSTTALEVDAHGRVYYCDQQASTLYRMDPGPNGYSDAVPLLSCSASSICLEGSSGQLFITEGHAVKLLRVVKALPTTAGQLESDLADLLVQEEEDNFADVVFVVEGQNLRGHRAILANRCVRLKQIMKKQDADEPINVEGSYKAWCALFAYLYTDRVHIDEATCYELLQLADSYDLDRLKRLVEEYILKRVRLDSALEVLRRSHDAHAMRLKKVCLQLIVRNFAVLQAHLMSAGYDQMPDLLMEIIQAVPK
jgi:streptogramin lyase